MDWVVCVWGGGGEGGRVETKVVRKVCVCVCVCVPEGVGRILLHGGAHGAEIAGRLGHLVKHDFLLKWSKIFDSDVSSHINAQK